MKKLQENELVKMIGGRWPYQKLCFEPDIQPFFVAMPRIISNSGNTCTEYKDVQTLEDGETFEIEGHGTFKVLPKKIGQGDSVRILKI